MAGVREVQKRSNAKAMNSSRNDAGPKHYGAIRGMAKGGMMKLSHRGKIGRGGKGRRKSSRY